MIIDDKSKNIGLALGLFLKLWLLICLARVGNCGKRTHVSWYSPKWQKMVTRGEELLNKVIIFVFSAHKKYFWSFAKLTLSH